MDNIRFALLCALGIAGFFLWQAWEADYPAQSKPQAPASAKQPAQTAASETNADLPPQAPPDNAPANHAKQAKNNSGSRQASAGRKAASPLLGGKKIHVVTDKLDVIINTRGGDLRRVTLLGVPKSADKADGDYRLLNNRPPNFFVTQSGLVGAKRSAPDHRDSFTSQRNDYQLAAGENSLKVPLHWQAADGREVTKLYTFKRGSYAVDLQQVVTNDSKSAWTVNPYLRFWRTAYHQGGSTPFSHSFMGVGWYQAKEGGDGYRFKKVGFDDLDEKPLKARQRGGWIGMMNHYFVGAVVPPANSKVSFFAQPKAAPGTKLKAYSAGYIGQATTVAPGATAQLDAQLFLGPKFQDQLDAVAPGLGLTVDYGIFTVIAGPIFWVLKQLHSVVGNWGVAIILLTVIIKLLFYKLSETQYRAMARMRKFGPRMKQLKEQYGDDRAKLQEKTMELYKKEGFNPLGGCWPLLVQMPVFIALYWVLRESVQLRHAGFALWINDLSAPDPYYILPALFGVIMFVQQRLSANTMTMDPMQARLMQIMPVGMAVFFAFFPAGLVLYWCTNNLLSITQQWYIYRKLDAEGLSHKAAAK